MHGHLFLVLESDDFRDIVEECGRVLDDSLGILADLEFELDSAKEDAVKPSMTREDLVEMAHDVADSVRIRKAESSFVRRYLS